MNSKLIRSSFKQSAITLGFGLVVSAAMLAAPAFAQDRVDAGNGVVVNLADKSLTKKVQVEGARMVKVGPVTRVQVSLYNSGKSPKNIQYRAQWFDENGFEITTQDRWEPATIDGLTSRSIDVLGNFTTAATVIVNVKSS